MESLALTSFQFPDALKYIVQDPGPSLNAIGRLVDDELDRLQGAGKKNKVVGPSEVDVPLTFTLDFDSRDVDVYDLTTFGDTPPPDASGSGLNLSRDGNTAVGYIDNGFFTPYHAFRWTETTGVVDLGTLDLPNNATKSSFSHDVSSDGSVIVGYSSTAGVKEHVYRWTQATGMVDLDAVNPESHQSRGFGTSSDGSVIVGKRDNRAFRWTVADGFQGLGSTAFSANAVNADGSVVVGHLTPGTGGGAFRWTPAGGLQDLGKLPGHTYGWATGVSDDGNIIVGVSTTGFIDNDGVGGTLNYDEAASRAFYWTEAGGMQDLTQLLAGAGADLNGSTMVAATGISADGAWIGGAAVAPDLEPGDTAAVLASLTVTLPDAFGNCRPASASVSHREMAKQAPRTTFPGSMAEFAWSLWSVLRCRNHLSLTCPAASRSK